MDLTDINVIKQLFKKHNFKVSKSLGQNFLINNDIIKKIIDKSDITASAGVIEIGPGIGVLTKELCKNSKKVVAVELDDRLFPILKETLSEFDNYKIIKDDVLKIDFNALIDQEFKSMDVRVCANLPYYITTPIIMKILKQQTAVKSLTLMVQKEVALRLCADERSRDNGAVSLAVRYYSKPNLLFFVPSDNFMPRPKVDSAVIRLDILDKPAVRADDEQFLFKVIKACFSQRRKTLVNSLCATLEFDKAFIENCLIEMGKDKKIRGEQLSLEEYCLLCKKMLKL